MKKKLFMSLSVLIIGFLISTSSLNNNSLKALLEEKNNRYTIDSFDSADWKWTTTEVVSTECTSIAINPSITADSSDNIHAVWYDETNYDGSGVEPDIFYKKWNTLTNTWTLSEVLSVDETYMDDNYPSIAIDSSQNIHIVWEQADYFMSTIKIVHKMWNQSTSSWNDTSVISTESGDPIRPAITTDNVGNVHVVWQDRTNYNGAGSDWDIFYKRWDSLSSSWTTTEVVSTESSAQSLMPSLCADSQNNIHIVWEDDTDFLGSGTDRDIFYKRWDTQSSSWTASEIVSSESDDISDKPFIEIDSSDNLHVVWRDISNYPESNTDWDIFYKKKSVTTKTWSLTEVVSFELNLHCYDPVLVTDSLNNIHIVWSDSSNYDNSGSDWDIYYKRYDVLSNSWTLAEIVSTESTSNSLNPSLTIDSYDTIHCVWEDTTDYRESGIQPDIFYKKFISPLRKPELSFIVPNPTDFSSIYLDWNNISQATSYYVYRSDYYIWSVEELVPIATVTSSEFIDTLPSEGYFYYVIVAGNFAGNSTHSNCQYVEYKVPHLREFSLISSLVLTVAVVALVILKTRKIKPK